MKNYIIVLITSLFSLVYSQTGLFVDNNTSAFGVVGTYEKFIDCDGCPTGKTLTFNYLTPFNLEFSIAKNTLLSSYSDYSYSYNGWGLGYYFDMNSSKLRLGYHFSKIIDDDFESWDQGTLSLTSKSNDGLLINLSIVSEEIEDCYSYYTYWGGYEYECDSYSDTYEILSIGTFFEIDSYVFGIAYTNTADEDFFEFDYGALSLSVGSFFKR